jgi:hypothetical protein
VLFALHHHLYTPSARLPDRRIQRVVTTAQPPVSSNPPSPSPLSLILTSIARLSTGHRRQPVDGLWSSHSNHPLPPTSPNSASTSTSAAVPLHPLQPSHLPRTYIRPHISTAGHTNPTIPSDHDGDKYHMRRGHTPAQASVRFSTARRPRSSFLRVPSLCPYTEDERVLTLRYPRFASTAHSTIHSPPSKCVILLAC